MYAVPWHGAQVREQAVTEEDEDVQRFLRAECRTCGRVRLFGGTAEEVLQDYEEWDACHRHEGP